MGGIKKASSYRVPKSEMEWYIDINSIIIYTFLQLKNKNKNKLFIIIEKLKLEKKRIQMSMFHIIDLIFQKKFYW